MSLPNEFENVTATCKANVYFEGKVISHSITLADGSKKTLGVIQPGEFHFNTKEPELMQLIDGEVRVRLQGQAEWTTHIAPAEFRVPGDSAFDIAVDTYVAQYICSFG